MKTITTLMRALGVAALVLLVGTCVALAHGTPTMSAQPATVAAGGKITLSGDGMGTDGQTVTLTLKGMTFQATLGTTKLTDDAYDGVTFTIPAKAPPGTYLIVAQNGSINASASIEVTASATPKPVAQPTAKPTALPTALPTTMAAMTTPLPPTATAAASAAPVATDQAIVATPLATTEPIAAQPVAATPATAATPLTTGDATGAQPVVATVPAAQPAADNASAANAPADQPTVDATMPMAGAVAIPVRVHPPLHVALTVGFIVVAGGLGLFVLTRHLA